MEIILHEIKDSEVWAIEVKNNGKSRYTLHYDNEDGESVLHMERALVGFESFDCLKKFCGENHLSLVRDELAHSFDFDFEITQDAPCKMLIEHWNLLAVMAKVLGLGFEGTKKEYSKLYNRLFDHAPAYNSLLALDKIEQGKLERVFSGKDEILSKFVDY